jgi:arylsulfatase A-like enzyme
MATIADVAGVSAPADIDGISYLPELTGRAGDQKRHEYLFWDFSGYGGQIAVRMGKWKGIRKGLRKRPDAKLELYDLEKDIGENKNVAGQFPEIAKKIERVMVEARTEPEHKKFRFGKYRS